ncbi:hypothetical protein [Clostridium thermarum]|uniref:hypothetical protein n=1 Tax=Clostridium thermarum TaxID=1716543 RepID=UPI00111DC0C0|nr:hypothetical protein [Clostridium thermarum]
MAGVWNVNSIYNSTQKKFSGKLTFQTGETLAAKVVSLSEDGKNIVIRNLEGWQFPAVLEEPLKHMPENLLKLQVDGYENGKIKLKIITQDQQEVTTEQESLAKVIESNNLSAEDKELLKALAAFSIPLSRSNISKFKSLSNFLERLQVDEKEIPQFISKYLKSRNIDPQSERGKAIAETLKNFFQELKNLSLEELLLMEEVGIDLTEENIKSFKKVLKEPEGLMKSLDTILKEIDKHKEGQYSVKNTPIESDKALDTIQPKEVETGKLERSKSGESKNIIVTNIDDIDIEAIKAELESELINEVTKKASAKGQSLAYDRGNLFNNEVLDRTADNMLQDLRPFAKGSESKMAGDIVNKIINEDPSSAMLIEREEIVNKLNDIDSMIKAEIRSNEYLKIEIAEYKDSIKYDIKEKLDLLLKENEFLEKESLLKDLKLNIEDIDDIIEEGLQAIRPFAPAGENKQIREIVNKLLDGNQELKALINPDTIVEKLASINHKLKTDIDFNEEIRNSVNDFKSTVKYHIKEKLFNLLQIQVSGEDVTINKDFISKTVEHMVEQVQTLVRSGDNSSIEGIVKTVLKENLAAAMQLEPEKLEKTLLNHIKIQDKQKSINMREAGDSPAAIIEGIESKLEKIKSMIESIVTTKSELGQESWNGILNNLKSSFNDIKTFNSISGQYYYLDLPIELNKEEYPCKLIIKDDRKSGKKIDSNNVKMAVSITTVNMGIIDAYITVKDKNMKVDFKCDEKWTRALDMAKEKLWKLLDNSVYNIVINVSKREKTMDIVNCRDFFEEAGISNINVIV